MATRSRATQGDLTRRMGRRVATLAPAVVARSHRGVSAISGEMSNVRVFLAAMAGLVASSCLGCALDCGGGGAITVFRGGAQLDPQDPLYVFFALVMSVFTDFLSGMIAGFLARGAEVRAGGLAGGLMLVLAVVLFFPLGMEKYPLWYNIPAYVAVVPAGLLGAAAVRAVRTLREERLNSRAPSPRN